MTTTEIEIGAQAYPVEYEGGPYPTATVEISPEIIADAIAARVQFHASEVTDPETGDIWEGHPLHGGTPTLMRACAAAALAFQRDLDAVLVGTGSTTGGVITVGDDNGRTVESNVESLRVVFYNLPETVHVAIHGRGR